MRRKIIITLSILFLFIFILVFYFNQLSKLPLFGDSTIYSKATNELIKNNFISNQKYPLGYNTFQAILVSLLGEVGYKLPVLIGLSLIMFFLILFSKKIIGKYYASIPILLLFVLFSPKLIFYSSRMYMEILISSLFLISFYYIFLFIKEKNITFLYLSFIFILISVVIKQTGLLLLFFPFIFFMFFYIKNKRFILISLLILTIFITPFYWQLYHNTGELYPGSNNLYIIKNLNSLISSITGYNDELVLTKWDDKLIKIEKDYYNQGAISAETRHIWPTDIFSSNGFVKSNSLYLMGFWDSRVIIEIFLFFNLFLLIGMVIFIKNSKKLNYTHFLFFIFLFLIITYASFIKNNDQMRYHLYLPIIFSVFFIIPLLNLELFLDKRIIILLFSISLILLTFQATEDFLLNERWSKTQIYSPSIGGIDSIQNSAEWFKSNSRNNSKFFQICGNEFSFYSNRVVIDDWRYMFLSNESFQSILKDQEVGYITIFESQIVEDSEWTNFCKIKRSFVEQVKSNNQLVYQSNLNDIFIYKIL